MDKCLPKCPPDIDIDIELDIDKDIDKDKELDSQKNLIKNKKIAEVIKEYENSIGLINNNTERELLLDYIDEFDKDIVIYAIKLAEEKNKRDFNYIKGILNKWSKANITTLDQAKNFYSNNQEKESVEDRVNKIWNLID